MIDSTLLETLRHLTEEEQTLLYKFVHSPFFHYADNASGVISLFNDLMKYAPKFDIEQELSREVIALRLNKTPQYVIKTASGLHTVIKDFIAWQFKEKANNDFFDNLALLKFYHQRNLNQRFESLYGKLSKDILKKTKSLNHTDLYHAYLLNAQLSEWLSERNPIQDLNLKNTINSLDAYFIFRKAQITFSLLFRSINHSVEIEGYLSVIQDIERFCLHHSGAETQLLLVYYEAILLLIEREDADITNFQTALTENEDLLSKEDYLHLRIVERFCVLQKFNRGDYHILPQVFEMYRSHLEKGLLEGSGYLMPTTFANIVRYGCRMKELDWVEDFLKKYEHRLGGVPNPKDLFQLYFAYFLIHKKQFDKAEEHLSADFDDPIIKVEARCFELMLMYETDSKLIDYKIESFRKLVRNTIGIPDVRRDGFHNFALTLRKMINPDLRYNDKRIEKVIMEINATPTSESIWLIQKLQKLKRRKS